MIVLILFAFLAGIVTILSPCILPVLPIVLSSSLDNTGKRKPFGVVVGFIASFTFFTMFLSTLVQTVGISAEYLRLFAITILIAFGLSLIIPSFQLFLEKITASFIPSNQSTQPRTGFFGGIIVGLSLGLLWTPCVGPILASVISLALTGSVSGQALVITLSYAVGTAIPMFFIMYTGNSLIRNIPGFMTHIGSIQKVFGIIMIITAIGLWFNIDRTFQTAVLQAFPTYGQGLTSIEDTAIVRKQLEAINPPSAPNITIGSPLSDIPRPKGPKAPELIQGGQWFNSEPLTLAQLKGKVVIVDFWTYSCINCQRTLPYLRKWWDTYKNDGLVIIGIHAPEFEFEKDAKNVATAINDFHIGYPVMQDNNFSTWRAYNNHYWPAKYLIDKEGNIRYTHFGEGEYDQTEAMIQTLLKEAGAQEITRTIENPTYQVMARTPETYLGYGRMDHFASPESVVQDRPSSYSFPDTLPANSFALNGTWNITEEYAQAQQSSSLSFSFDAQYVYLVMKPAHGQSIVNILIDGSPQYLGKDVVDGKITINEDRLYELVRLSQPGKHILSLEVEEGDVDVYAFTFG